MGEFVAAVSQRLLQSHKMFVAVEQKFVANYTASLAILLAEIEYKITKLNHNLLDPKFVQSIGLFCLGDSQNSRRFTEFKEIHRIQGDPQNSKRIKAISPISRRSHRSNRKSHEFRFLLNLALKITHYRA